MAAATATGANKALQQTNTQDRKKRRGSNSFGSFVDTSEDIALLEGASQIEGGKGAIGASGILPDLRERAQERLDEVLRQRRRGFMRDKPGLVASILTSGLGLKDDDDNIRRPILLGGRSRTGQTG